jgi:hypothetical protein
MPIRYMFMAEFKPVKEKYEKTLPFNFPQLKFLIFLSITP